MVSIQREAMSSGPVVTGFADSAFVIGEEVYDDGLWLTPERAVAWDAPSVARLDMNMIDPLLELDPVPEFLLLGTGAKLERPSARFVADLEDRNIGVEAMDSRAAARAWGVLRAEDRWIVAALLPL